MPLEEFYAAPRGTYGNALLNWMNHAPSDVVSYAVAYRNAAHNLIAHREQLGAGEIDQAACPIIFLFRHSVELYLKGMVYRLSRLSVDDTELQQVLPRLWREHSLMRLLSMAQPVLTAMRQKLPLALRDFDEEDLEFLSDLDRIDPGSYSFRYPVASSGGPSLPGFLITNIFVFAEHADRVLDSLREGLHNLGTHGPM
jgi:hypothetical protein